MPQKYILGSRIIAINNHFNLNPASDSGQVHESELIIKTGHLSLIITQENPHKLSVSSFGMTPSWAKQPMQIINARAEGDKNSGNDPNYSGSKAIFLKKSFRNSLFNKRCIVVADAFITYCGNQPWLVYLKEKKRPLGMAGLYDEWTNPITGEKLHSFAIITITSNSLLQKIQVSRMPMILPFGAELNWLKPSNHLSEILSKLIQYPSQKMNAHPISSEIEKSNDITTEQLKPIGTNLSNEVQTQPFPGSNQVSKKKPSEPGKLWFANK